MTPKREFFPRVKKTVMPRPVEHKETDILGAKGVAWAYQATIYGSNWYYDQEEKLIEIYDAGPALMFRDLLPLRDKYKREGLYLRISIAYRTTANANANIRTFSGNHVSLPNAVEGAMYEDPNCYYWVTDDMTINVNSLYTDEKLWIQRVEWEWVSREVVYYDELVKKGLYLNRTKEEVDALYEERQVTESTVRDYLIHRIQNDEHFAKRCVAMLRHDQILGQDMVSLYKEAGLDSD